MPVIHSFGIIFFLLHNMTVFLMLGISLFTVVYFNVSVIYVAVVCTNYRILHDTLYLSLSIYLLQCCVLDDMNGL